MTTATAMYEKEIGDTFERICTAGNAHSASEAEKRRADLAEMELIMLKSRLSRAETQGEVQLILRVSLREMSRIEKSG